MIKVEDKIISLDVIEKYFVCDLNACKGACCVEGDSGAPLEEKEKETLKKNFERIKPYMQRDGIHEVEKNGVAIFDNDGDLTTPLINNRECAFSIQINGITKCSIETAYSEGKTSFKKPISCHLFPIRIKEYKDFDAVNYEEIKICESGCACGIKLEQPLYIFLKEPLIRKYGIRWYEKLLDVAEKILDERE